MKRAALSGLVAIAAMFAQARPTHADFINGSFQTGDLSGWTVFTTPGGTNGTLNGVPLPDVVSFNTSGTGATNSAHFNVGGPGGGGITQTVTVGTTGLYTITGDFASQDDPNGLVNADAGTFSILVDGTKADTVSLGSFSSPFQILRGQLSATVSLTAGSHVLGFEITRFFDSADTATPQEYLTDLQDNIPSATTPEPATLTMLATGLVAIGGFVGVRRRRPGVPT